MLNLESIFPVNFIARKLIGRRSEVICNSVEVFSQISHIWLNRFEPCKTFDLDEIAPHIEHVIRPMLSFRCQYVLSLDWALCLSSDYLNFRFERVLKYSRYEFHRVQFSDGGKYGKCGSVC